MILSKLEKKWQWIEENYGVRKQKWVDGDYIDCYDLPVDMVTVFRGLKGDSKKNRDRRTAAAAKD